MKKRWCTASFYSVKIYSISVIQLLIELPDPDLVSKLKMKAKGEMGEKLTQGKEVD